MTVTLELLTNERLDAFSPIELDPGQEPFAGGPLDAVLDGVRGMVRSGSCHPFAICHDKQAIGFVLLRSGDAVPEWATPDVVTLHNLRIDRSYQGQGHARSAISQALSWARENCPTAIEMQLAVNERNTHARGVYLTCGFHETGKIHVGALGPQAILSYRL